MSPKIACAIRGEGIISETERELSARSQLGKAQAEFTSAGIKAQRRWIVSVEVVARSAEAEIKLARILVRHRLPLIFRDVQEFTEFL